MSKKEKLVQAQMMLRQATTIDDITQSYEAQQEIFKRVEESNYYFYTINERPETIDEAPHLGWEVVDLFYSSIQPKMKAFARAQHSLLDFGRHIHDNDIDALQIAMMKVSINNAVNDMINGLQAMNSARPGRDKSYAQRSDIARIKIQRFLESVNTEQPEELRETLRRYIPTFVTHPIPFPAEFVSENVRGELAEVWQNYTSADAGFLIHPNKTKDGMPFHLVMEVARELEERDQEDDGYLLRVYAIIQILAMEKERAALTENAELPLFTYMADIAMTAVVKKVNKTAYFEYDSALDETMTSTIQRLQAELEAGQPGLAQDFLSQLRQYFPDIFPQLLGQSIVNKATKTRQINEISIIKHLEKTLPEFDQVFEQIQEHNFRRVLSHAEVDELMGLLPEPAEQISQENFLADVQLLITGQDSYTLRRWLKVSDVKKSLQKGEATNALIVDIEAPAEILDVRMVFVGADGRIRFIPFKLSFSGKADSFSIKTLTEGSLKPETVQKMRTIVGSVLEAQVKRSNLQPTLPVEKQAPIFIPASTPVTVLTREERKKRYEEQKALEEKKKKTTKVQPQVESLVEEEAPQEIPQTQHPRKIKGMSYRSVVEMLNDEHIESVDPERLIKKVEHLVELANVSGHILGKRIRADLIPSSDLNGEVINLRQINWALDGGVTQIRIYLEAEKQGNFVFRGVFLKKGLTQQTAYLKDLLHKIVRDRSLKESGQD